MIALLAAAALVPAAYGFTPETKTAYHVNVDFQGFIPVFGGSEGSANVDLDMDVNGAKADASGNQSASGDLTAVKIKFNDATLPFDVDQVRNFFPKTTISFTPNGKVVTSDAPNLVLPVRLPGLDVKRFPELTYLPIELPTDGLELNKKWTFSKEFSDGKVDYKATVAGLTSSEASIEVEVAQTYTSLESASLEIVKNEADAEWLVKTELTGGGTVVFDLVRGLAKSVDVKTLATSQATHTKTKVKKERKLRTTLKVELKG